MQQHRSRDRNDRERALEAIPQRFEFSFEPRFLLAITRREPRRSMAIFVAPGKEVMFASTSHAVATVVVVVAVRAPARSREKWRKLKIAQKVTEKLRARIVL